MTQSQPQAGFSDEQLMAFADGELDEATCARIEAAMEHDDALIERVAVFMETRASAQAALKPQLDEPVPEALLAAVQAMVDKHEKQKKLHDAKPVTTSVINDASDEVTAEADKMAADIIQFRTKPRVSTYSHGWNLAAAAMVLAAFTGLGGYFMGQSGVSTPRTGEGALTALTTAAIENALQTTASGQDIALTQQNATMQITATFRDGQNQLCREYRVDNAQSGYIAVSCYESDKWQLRFALASQQDSQNYMPASAQETVDAYLTSINAGAPLSKEEERAVLNC